MKEPPSRRTAEVVAFATVVGLSTLAVRLLVHAVESPFAADWRYRVAAVAGAGSTILFATLLGWPLALWPRRVAGRLLATLLAAPLALTHAAAAHYHAVLNRLPGRGTLALLSGGGLPAAVSGRELWLTAEVLVPCTLAVLLAPRLARELAPDLERPRRPAIVLASIAAVGLASVAAAHAATGQLRWGSTQPLLALLAPAEQVVPPAGAPAPNPPSTGVVGAVQRLLGAAARGDPPDPGYPLCFDDPVAPPPDLRARSIILLVLEGVSDRELPFLPALERIAGSGIRFRRFHAAGDRSAEGLVSMLSGIGPATHRRLLDHAPLVSLHGLPGDLRRAGYRTVYAHGSDLSFEQQRAYLRAIGFEEIVEPSPAELRNRIGWGIPDGPMLDRLVAWIERARTDGPYLAALFTLSTHDPYALPEGAPPGPVPGDGPWARYARALAYLDAELERFRAWYEAEERPRGTLLVVTSDHAPRVPHPDDPVETSTGELEHRFRIPLVIAGDLDPPAPPGAGERPGGHLDIAQTILGRLGWPRLDCYQGRDLLAGGAWPEGRLVVSIAGEQLERFYVHDGDLRFEMHLPTRVLHLHDVARDPLFRNDVTWEADPRSARVSALIQAYLTLGYYLNFGDRFAPPARAPRRAPIEPVARPIVVAHRKNDLDAIAAAAATGFEWVEVDVQLTRDRVPVLRHDPGIEGLTLAELREREPGTATLREALERFGRELRLCIELKSQPDVFLQMDLVRETLLLLEELPPIEVVVDSFSRTMLASIDRVGPATGYDLPQRPVQAEWLDYAAGAGFDWVYVRHDVAGPDVVRQAHARGLRVMVYDVPPRFEPDSYGVDVPDGVMTDNEMNGATGDR